MFFVLFLFLQAYKLLGIMELGFIFLGTKFKFILKTINIIIVIINIISL